MIFFAVLSSHLLMVYIFNLNIPFFFILSPSILAQFHVILEVSSTQQGTLVSSAHCLIIKMKVVRHLVKLVQMEG